MLRMKWFAAAALAVVAVLAFVTSAGAQPVTAAPTATSTVVVPREQPVQFTFTADTTHDPVIAQVSVSAEDAIQMAIQRHPAIRGFRVQVSDVETDCGGDNSLSATEHRGARQHLLGRNGERAADLPGRGSRHDLRFRHGRLPSGTGADRLQPDSRGE
jgi:hypothetical protein